MSEYHCKYCEYTTKDKAHYKRHNSTERHKNKALTIDWELPNEPIVNKEYSCVDCNFVTVSKYNYDRHIDSIKHSSVIGTEKVRKNKKSTEKCNNYICLNCNIHYASPSGLWRHKKQCSHKVSEDANSFVERDSGRELVEFLLKENKEFKQIIIDQGKQMIELAKSQQPHNNTNNSHNTTNNNQKFNLNFFLNETCKDAINFSEFMNSIKVTLEDLEKTSQLGYVDGISRIFINALKNTDMEHRPLHCTDIKRETVYYIKEGNKWDKENKEQENLKRAVEYISNKNLGQIQEWKKENPESMDFNHPKSEVLNTMYTASLSKDPEKEDSKIIHKVLNEVALEKDMVVS